jgi:hypothetical protein
MKIHLPTILAAFGCVALASCYPFNESQNRKGQNNVKDMKKAVEQTPEKTEAEMKAAKEKAAAKAKARTEAKKKKIAEQGDAPEISTTAPDPGKEETTTASAPPVKEKRKEYPTATKAPGKDGFVLSPYNNKLVDVRGMASGTLVQDPTYSGEGSGRFRVP